MAFEASKSDGAFICSEQSRKMANDQVWAWWAALE
jgi:hypothetical protein